MKFGERLRELRKGRGLTLRALAEAVGVDFTYLSKIENGKSGYLPGADTIRLLAEALETDPLELLELADKVPPEMEQVPRVPTCVWRVQPADLDNAPRPALMVTTVVAFTRQP